MRGEPTMDDVTIKQGGKHRKDCAAVKEFEAGTWETPWALLIETRRLPPSRAKGGVRWLVFCCNDPTCSAELLVSESDLLVYAAKERADA